MKKPTRKDIEALRFIGEGIDVYSPMLARTCRDLERVKPALLTICRAYYPEGSEVGIKPFFGAKLTGLGKELVAAAAAKKGGMPSVASAKEGRS